MTPANKKATPAAASSNEAVELIGTSGAMEEVRHLVSRVAPSDLTVLITGETGTGKDMVARHLHAESARASGPFVKVNCPSIQESLLESELFGHEKGAFTGATTASGGRLEVADKGTLFLDEISEASRAVQSKLLLAIDGEPFMRVGGVRPIHSDVRIVAATNIPLEDLVRRGKMSEEALFRLAEVVIHLPTLRERLEDVPLLAEHFNRLFCEQFGRPCEPLPSQVLEQWQASEWPGNVRELSARVREYLLSGKTQAIPQQSWTGANPRRETAEAASLSRPRSRDRQFIPLKEAARRAVEEAERALIQEALEYTLWNRRKAARLLDISYSSLLRRIEAYQIGKS